MKVLEGSKERLTNLIIVINPLSISVSRRFLESYIMLEMFSYQKNILVVRTLAIKVNKQTRTTNKYKAHTKLTILKTVRKQHKQRIY